MKFIARMCLLGICALAVNLANAQIQWTYFLPEPAYWSSIYTIKELPDGRTAAVYIANPIATEIPVCHLIVFDLNGVLLADYALGYPGLELSSPHILLNEITGDLDIFCAGMDVSDGTGSSVYYARFDNAGNLINTITYPVSDSRVVSFTAVRNSALEFVILGGVGQDGGLSTVNRLLMHLAADGSLLEQQLLSNNGCFFQAFSATKDGDEVIVGTGGSTGCVTTGHFIWFNSDLNVTHSIGPDHAIPQVDGGPIQRGVYLERIGPGRLAGDILLYNNDGTSEGMIGLYNDSGAVVSYFKPEGQSYASYPVIRGGIRSATGELIFAYTDQVNDVQPEVVATVGHVYKLDSTLNVLGEWIVDGHLDSTNYQIYTVHLTADGGALAAGSSTFLTDPANPDRAFIVKWGPQYNGVAETLNVLSALTVFPSPGSDHMTVKLGDHNGIAEIRLFDSLGRIVRSVSVTNNSTEVDTQDLSSGLYTVIAFSATGNTVARARWVRQ